MLSWAKQNFLKQAKGEIRGEARLLIKICCIQLSVDKTNAFNEALFYDVSAVPEPVDSS